MADPEYLICLNCETPTYLVEYEDGKLLSVTCQACGNDEPAEFMTENELDEQREG
jgi:translation initiation factor 2 beta subunit (eIF-2beta)/eIF-5